MLCGARRGEGLWGDRRARAVSEELIIESYEEVFLYFRIFFLFFIQSV